ncbi:MAG: YlxR family protein [Ruminococcaceae bacterium]|nr:YlxR family protein [Oscillospiraceae bacterium]
MKTKKIPLRRCVACFESKPKQELLRIVRKANDGEIILDTTGKANGRGAYICPDPECFTKMEKGNKLSKEFETEINLSVYSKLKEQFDLLQDVRREK